MFEFRIKSDSPNRKSLKQKVQSREDVHLNRFNSLGETHEGNAVPFLYVSFYFGLERVVVNLS